MADTVLSHLMKIMYMSRLCRADVVTTTSFLARRVHYWSLNDDRRLHRLMSYIFHHLDLCLVHELHPDDRSGAFLDFSPDAELGGTPTPPKPLAAFGWSSPPPGGRESGPFPSGQRKPLIPAVRPLIPRRGVSLDPMMLF